MATVKPEDLARFATTESGPTQLGELIRRLVFCWVPDRVASIGFHSGTANNLPDWDGYVRLKAHPGEPEFRSLWELSTQNATGPKIRSDVAKSFKREAPPGWVKSQTTYVAVTLRKLQNVAALEQELATLPGNPWQSIRIIDAPALAQWIEKCPAVEAWCAEFLGIGAGVFGISLDAFWSRWALKHQPKITLDLVTAGRESSTLDRAFRPVRGQTITLLTDSASETAAYLYAYLKQRSDQDETVRVLSNCLIVDSIEAANRLAIQPVTQTQIPITILLPPANEAAYALTNAGHYVVNAIGYAVNSHSPIVIKRALRREFAAALQRSMGMALDQADHEARACGGSLSVWSVWNRHAGNAVGVVPAWCEGANLTNALPAVVAPGWDERIAGDKAVLESLSGSAYSYFKQTIDPFRRSDPPFFERVGSVVSVIAPTVAFALTARSISTELLQSLEQAITDVFSKIDPKSVTAWGSSPSLPMAAAVSEHSDWLRDALLETVLRISAFKDVLDEHQVAYHYGGCQAYVDKVVAQIARFQDDPRFFAALSSNLPIMAEAAPIPFVDALEEALQGLDSSIAPLFEDRGIFAPIHHAGLLSALECLAWEPSYLARVCRLLARLVKYENNGRVLNKPSNSLRAIFLAWDPRTSANLAQRVEVLRLLTNEFPDDAWKLICLLLPKHSDTSFSTREPAWKDFGRSARQNQTPTLIREAFSTYVGLALALSEGSPKRQLSLISDYPLLSPEHKELLRRQLCVSADENTLSLEVRDAIWSDIRQLVAKHRRFANAVWAMDKAAADALEAVSVLFRPTSKVEEIVWLFDEYSPDLPDVGVDVETALERAGALRDTAIKNLAADGVGPLDELLSRARYPHLVAQQIALSIDDDSTMLSLLDRWFVRDSRHDEIGIRALCVAKFGRDGSVWMNALSSAARDRGWPDWALGLCFAEFPDSESIFQQIELLPESAATKYWATRDSYIRTDDTMLNDRIAEQMILHGRSVDLLNQSMQRLTPQVALRVFQEAIRGLKNTSRPIHLLGYHIKESLEWLQSHDDISRKTLAELEYTCLPVLLDELRDGEQLAVHREMAEDPSIFLKFVCDAFRPASSRKSEKRLVDSDEQNRAVVAWRTLQAWRTSPGLNSSQQIEYSALMTWMREARRLASHEDRQAVADQFIGSMLTHTPPDEGRAWPAEVVSRVIEEVASKDLEQGVATEVINSRGVTSRGVFDGGTLELDLFHEWIARADAVPEKWPRMKRVCRQIADSWKQMAKQFDVGAAQNRLRYN